MKRTTILIVLALIVFAISSCSKTPTTSGSGSLLATWKKPYMSYTVGVTFKSDNTFSFGIYSGSSYTETITGNWTSTSTSIHFTNPSGSMEACPGVESTYNYVINGNNITISDNSDACSGRSSKIDGTWTK